MANERYSGRFDEDDPPYDDQDEIQRQLDELQSESQRNQTPTPDLAQRKRGIAKPLIITVVLLLLVGGGFLGWNALQDDAEPPELQFTFEPEPEPQDDLGAYVSENRTALNENVAHINAVSGDLSATQQQLQELIASLQQLNLLLIQQNQEEIITKVKELDTRQRGVEEQIRQSFQFQADTTQINERLAQVISNHNDLVDENSNLKAQLNQLTLDVEYLTQRLDESQASDDEIKPSTEAELIRALAECQDESLEKPPGFERQNVSIADQLEEQYRRDLANGETSVFLLEEKLAQCLNPVNS